MMIEARPLEGRHVLVVEDDADSRNAIRLTLEASGAKVGTAASASEALAALVARPFAGSGSSPRSASCFRAVTCRSWRSRAIRSRPTGCAGPGSTP
jgi:hypothetical protein